MIVGGEEGGKWTGGFGRSLRAPLLSPFVGQRLTMLASKERATDQERLTTLIEAGRVAPSIDGSYPLDRVGEAMRHLESGRCARQGSHHHLRLLSALNLPSPEPKSMPNDGDYQDPDCRR